METVNIEELVQDRHNFNKGTDEGSRLMEKSFTELGAGRSILIDKDGNIIAGNKSQLAAMKAGIKKVRVIESDGSELIAVKRTDVAIDSKKGRELALADNLTTQVNLSWDEAELETVAAEQGIDLPDWGLDPAELGLQEPTDEHEENEQKERQRDPESEIIVATVSLFGTTEDMMLTEQLTTEQADKLIQLAKAEGAANLMKRIIDAL